MTTGGVFCTEGNDEEISNSSTKLKLSTLSSTESKVVTLGEKLPKSTWFQLFCIAQGGYTKKDILIHDNQSTIILANKNVPYYSSACKGSKYLDIRYVLSQMGLKISTSRSNIVQHWK